MNLTERYIKMCEKAEEIQNKWEPKTGDWATDVWHRNPVAVIEKLDSKNLLVSQVGGGQYENTRDKFIWLPTQEQLQEMTGDSVGEKIDDFYWWVVETFATNKRYRDSLEDSDIKRIKKEKWTMNELWLAFAMWKKYRKVWDDEKEEWRKI